MNLVRISSGFFFLIAVLFHPSPAVACVCCTDPGQRWVETQILETSVADILNRLRFADDAMLFVDEGGLEELRGLRATSDIFELEVTKGTREWRFIFRAPNQQASTISFAFPRSFTNFQVDPRDEREAGHSPTLYKEWRFTAPLQGTGIFGPASTDARSATLILQGRGNSCTEERDFTAWTIVLHGGEGTNTLFGSLDSAVPATDNDRIRGVEFKFGIDRVCSISNEEACIALGSPWNVTAVEEALPGYKIAYSDECEGRCYFAQTERGILEVLPDKDDKVGMLRSLYGSVDVAGNAIGDPLSRAVGPVATCTSGLNFVCWKQKASDIGYIVEGCDISLQGTGGTEQVAIPDCAVIAGFSLSVWGESALTKDSNLAGSRSAQNAESSTFRELPKEVQAYVSDVRDRCREVYAEVDSPIKIISDDDMDGILEVELDGMPAIVADNLHLCTDHVPAGNCSNRGCDVVIWRRDMKGAWRKVFDDHLHGRMLDIDSSSLRLRSMRFGLYAGDPRCQPEPNREYMSSEACILVARYKYNRWDYQREP